MYVFCPLKQQKKEEKIKINFFRYFFREIEQKWFYRRGQVHQPIRITRMMMMSQIIQKRQAQNQGKNTHFSEFIFMLKFSWLSFTLDKKWAF